MTAADKTAKRLILLGTFTFVISPLCAWGSVMASDETAVFASLSRMIWYSGSELRILVAMLIMFVPMLVSFFYAHSLSGMPKTKKTVCRVCMIISCVVLYIGAMWVMPGNGTTMTAENIWHGILSFSGMLMIFLTYCIYAAFYFPLDREGALLLIGLLAFSLATGAFAVQNIFDEKSYVLVSAVTELYVLIMMSLIGYLTYYLAYRKVKADQGISG